MPWPWSPPDAAAGLDGERDIPEFETTAIWQEEALLHPDEYAEGAEEGEHPAGLICESPEEFPEADEDVSQTVGCQVGYLSGVPDRVGRRSPST